MAVLKWCLHYISDIPTEILSHSVLVESFLLCRREWARKKNSKSPDLQHWIFEQCVVGNFGGVKVTSSTWRTTSWKLRKLSLVKRKKKKTHQILKGLGEIFDKSIFTLWCRTVVFPILYIILKLHSHHLFVICFTSIGYTGTK